MTNIHREAKKLSKKFPEAVIEVHTVVQNRGEPLYDDRTYHNGYTTGWIHHRAKPDAGITPSELDLNAREIG